MVNSFKSILSMINSPRSILAMINSARNAPIRHKIAELIIAGGVRSELIIAPGVDVELINASAGHCRVDISSTHIHGLDAPRLCAAIPQSRRRIMTVSTPQGFVLRSPPPAIPPPAPEAATARRMPR